MITFMKRYLITLGFVGLIFASYNLSQSNKAEAPRPAPEVTMDASAWTKKYANQIVKLTPVDKDYTGGTGFAIAGRSGNVFTVTNSHVCDLAKSPFPQYDQKLMARWDNGDTEELKVLEQDPKHDLCVLTGMKNKTGLPISWHQAETYDKVFVIGHPHLLPITYSEGLVQIYEEVDLPNDIRNEQECKEGGYEWKEINMLFFMAELCFQKFDSVATSVVGYPGNSGSPIFNANGDVTGVIFIGNGGTNFLGYVPLKHLTKLLENY